MAVEGTSQETLQHLTKTYRYMNENLQQSHVPTDSTVATVMSMAIHENLLGKKTRMHMEALGVMVSMRGGLDGFKDNSMLVQKICRADLGHALQSGCRPRFSRDAFPRELVKSMVHALHLEDRLRHVIDSVKPMSNKLSSILRDLTGVSYLLASGEFKLDPFVFQEIIISILYQLLHLRSLAGGPGFVDEVDDLWHLILLAFMSTMLFQTGHDRVLECDLLAEKLRESLNLALDYAIDDGVMFWVFFVAGVSVLSDEEDKTWLKPRLKRVADSLNIKSWHSAEQHLHNYPWIGVFHNGLARDLWNESRNC